ncbi:unnamed protein product [Aspergillus oryzae]|nr:unnamed protein product [Aspergillus oryzae]
MDTSPVRVCGVPEYLVSRSLALSYHSSYKEKRHRISTALTDQGRGILLSFGTAGCRSGANAYTLRHFQEPSYETR